MAIDLEERIEFCKEWLLNSDVQQKTGEHKGAFNSWYQYETKGFTFAYPEITGYGLTLLTYLHKLEGDNHYLAKAEVAADWIINKVIDDDGGCFSCFPYISEYKKNEGVKFTFDSGIILNGLVNLYRHTGEKKYLEASKKIGNWMLSMQNPDGSFIPYRDAVGQNKNTMETWSTQSGSYLSKVCIGLLNLYDIIGDENLIVGVKQSLRDSNKWRQANGRFRTYADYDSSNFHPHCYSCESYFVAGQFFDDIKHLKIATEGSKFLLHNLSTDGKIPRHYIDHKFNYNERSDIIAQTLRLAILTNENRNPDFISLLRQNYSRLINYHVSDGIHKGAFIFGNKSDGSPANNPNSWCSMFALQAMILYRDFKNNRINFEWKYMV